MQSQWRRHICRHHHNTDSK
ncbi:hypothetical protein FHL02_09120 [Lactobacillus salsicarnum]|uniref:Uncharacterized protein n=1 Tax=Companilactobacillus mishanensis TaxID=2486008 RepID=A0A5P0ZJ98_9LACO|nr:hypothetical protein [Companilactobacillus mishanensis]MQS90080.1 hypothetical protein [Companilactobacillus mishanensis]